MSLSGGMVRVRSPYSLSAKMDVVFDRYCDIGLLLTHDKVFKAKITSDFSFLDVAAADTDVVMDAAVIFLGQDDTIKYTVKKTGLSGCRLGGSVNSCCLCLCVLCSLWVCVSMRAASLMRSCSSNRFLVSVLTF